MRFTLLLLPFLLLSACAADETATADDGADVDTIAVVDDDAMADDGAADTPADAAADGAVYTLRGVNPGDVACYLDLEDEAGTQTTEMASFEMCEKADLVGQRVTLTHEMQDVLADSCQGDPECTETQEVSLVTAMEAAE